jgi:hypothetical protein
MPRADPSPAPALRPARSARRDGRLARRGRRRAAVHLRGDALERATSEAVVGGRIAVDAAVIAGATAAALGLGALTLRRRTP